MVCCAHPTGEQFELFHIGFLDNTVHNRYERLRIAPSVLEQHDFRFLGKQELVFAEVFGGFERIERFGADKHVGAGPRACPGRLASPSPTPPPP